MSAPLKRARILIVDDDEAVRESLHDELVDEYEVETAAGGREAIERLVRGVYDVVISDLRMPDVGGVEVLERARGLHPEAVRILLTGFLDEDARQATLREDAPFKIGKPWHGTIEVTLKRALEHREITRRMTRQMAELGRIDLVVNGAAGNFLAPAAQLSYNGFRTVMAIDALGTFNVCRAAFDKWLRDHGGSIINISATLHYGATPLQIHACAAKAAVDAMTRSLALEWGPLGIRVNGIAPGPIADTEGMAKLAPGEVAARFERAIPLRRFGRIDEIGNVALFLASDAASLIHGETIVADGGAWLAGTSIDW